jgi:DNA-binding PadR family transcriptional regulator
MSGHETRMLLLGAVALFEPVNGYQIRRELLSWQVEDWAHVNPGSIYSGLATLTRQAHLVRHDLVDGTRDVAVYEMTPTGSEELARLMATSLETVDLYDAVAFHAAFSMLPLIRRQEAIAHLDVRLRALEETIAEFEVGLREKTGLAPPHALHAVELQMKRAEVERKWLIEVLDETRSGGLAFLGEPADWAPADDDPGWQMNTDRERYRALLGR